MNIYKRPFNTNIKNNKAKHKSKKLLIIKLSILIFTHGTAVHFQTGT